MPPLAGPKINFAFGNEDYPILFEGNGLRVYTDVSSEIFIEDLRTGANMRISAYPFQNGGILFTTDQLVEPIRVTNLIGWRVGPR